ncbi:hypothetical protein CspeluHIS016_0602620 [Cutaneotrichosporon spelunceum]|uniref:CBF1-interacting co-repressor CIR N-terminal domain-containing protein n=1 Tax=Cutaneotrichosporon spelunceum TaxID=1672016 RepID=A0AAD3YD51_9TREE|nr:hypothetical protein CspeluHIS016_0602620 [Cutaneotrichosporon spelunceum]
MPRLQILHHKSYHPYSEKNKQRVREDEAKARAEAEQQQQQAIEAASEERLNALRRRAGTPEEHLALTGESSLLSRHCREKEKRERREKKDKERTRLDFDWPDKEARKETRKRAREDDRFSSGGQLDDDRFVTEGHVNFWADLESGKESVPIQPMQDAATRKAAQEADKLTMYLERPDRETRPWYADKELRHVEERGEEAERRRARDRRIQAKTKVSQDPLTAITKKLSTPARPTTRAPASTAARRPSYIQSERERALAMLAKRKGGSGGAEWEGPQSTHGSWADEFEREKDRAGHRYNPS